MSLQEKIATVKANTESIKTKLESTKGLDSITDWTYFFYSGARYFGPYPLPYNITCNGTKFQYMYMNNTKVTNVASNDTRKGYTLFRMFYGCTNLLTVGEFGSDIATDIEGMFYNCKKLTTIQKLNFGNATSVSNMFYNCSELTTINVEGTIKRSLSFSSSSKLSVDSMKSIIAHLENNKGTANEGKYSLTFHATAKANLIAEGATSPNGNLWTDYVVDLGWTC